MTLRAAFAAALAVAALPLAAPVAAQAESHDCIIFNNYRDNLLELMEQSHRLTSSAQDDGTVEAAVAVAPDAANVHHALAVQLNAMASQLISPVFKREMYDWANASEQTADYFRKLARRQSGQAELDQITRASAAFVQGSANYRDAGEAACNV